MEEAYKSYDNRTPAEIEAGDKRHDLLQRQVDALRKMAAMKKLRGEQHATINGGKKRSHKKNGGKKRSCKKRGGKKRGGKKRSCKKRN